MTIDSETPALPPLPHGAPDGCPYAPAPAMADLRDASGGLTKVRLPDGTWTWLATGYDRVREIIAHPAFSSSPQSPGFPSWNLPGGLDLPLNMTQADPPVHTRMRRMAGGEFSVRRIAELRPDIMRITDERCAHIESLPQPFDFVDNFATPIPATVICLMLGVPQDEYDYFVRRIRLVLAHDDLDSDQRQQAKLDLLQYMLRLIEVKREAPDGRLLSKLIIENPELDPVELVSYASSLLLAGFATTAHMIELSTLTMIEQPELAARIRADPDMIPDVVEELLRFHSVVRDSPRRAALADVEFGDVTIRAGEGVIASVQAANWDPTAFPDPERVDVDRPHERRNLAFGHGIHACIGAMLAKAELEIVLERIVTRYPAISLAVPLADVRFRTTTHLHGCYELPVDLNLGGPSGR
ncbi:cytochrome P450 [Mangrovihabitans endophyticus]|uniref:Cytochrome P450 n=1 Tax=Mangrovihabitans endophyticus TaxID=1751298 RepID=A0A8J3BZ03_9ACTN|nr:cytochrome P450 [Mangrovihabitans endophyticus]GGK86614.1 cytochrome P450 [Mangrovihabitans endophyticus]